MELQKKWGGIASSHDQIPPWLYMYTPSLHGRNKGLWRRLATRAQSALCEFLPCFVRWFGKGPYIKDVCTGEGGWSKSRHSEGGCVYYQSIQNSDKGEGVKNPKNLRDVFYGRPQTAIWSEIWFDPDTKPNAPSPFSSLVCQLVCHRHHKGDPPMLDAVPGIHRWTMKGFRDLVLFADNDWGTLLCVSFLGSQCVVDPHFVMVISCATSTMHIHFLGVFPPCQLHLLLAPSPIACALSGDRSCIQIFTVHCICQVRT